MLKKVITLLVIALGVSTASKLELRTNTRSPDAYWIESENLFEGAESIGRMMVSEIAIKAKEGTSVDSQGDVVAQKFVDIAQSFPETNINTKKWNIIIVDTNNSIIGKSRRSDTLAHFSYDADIYYATANEKVTTDEKYCKKSSVCPLCPKKSVLKHKSKDSSKADYEWYDSKLDSIERLQVLEALVQAQEGSNGDFNIVAQQVSKILDISVGQYKWDVIVVKTKNHVKGQSSKGCKFAYLRYNADVYYIVGH